MSDPPPPPPYLLEIHSRPPPTIPPSTWETWYTQNHLPTLFRSSSFPPSSSLALQSAALYRATSHPVRSEGIEGTLESLSLHRIRSPSSPVHEPSSERTPAAEEEAEEEEGKGKGKYLGLYRMERKGLRGRVEWRESLRIPLSDGGLGGSHGEGRAADEVVEMEGRELEVVDCVGEGMGDGDPTPYLIACEITGAHVGSWLRPQHIEAVSSQLQGYQRTLVYRPVESSRSTPAAASESAARGGGGEQHRSVAARSSAAAKGAVSAHSPLAMSVMGVDDQGAREEPQDPKNEKHSGKEDEGERKDTIVFYHELSHLRLGSGSSSPPSSPPVSSFSSETSSRDHNVLLESIREELEAIEGSEGYDFSLRCWELIAGETLGRKGGES